MVKESVFGIINDIQKMSMNDGPGYRTTVFLKGCALNCAWCHNPEGKNRYPEIIPFISNCTGCGECLKVCPTDAISLDRETSTPHIDRQLCSTCLQCVNVCQSDALIVWGKIMSVNQVMDEVLKDKVFYTNSKGGVTVSGGEPMVQSDFVTALFKAAKSEDISTALDTCGQAPWVDYEKVLPHTDLVLFDLKNMDTHKHESYAGLGNQLILENAEKIAEKGINMRIRIPVIPGTNDTTENWVKTAEFIKKLGKAVQGIDLLPYHPYVGGKYKAFGMDYPYPMGEGLEDESIEPIIGYFINCAPEVSVGG